MKLLTKTLAVAAAVAMVGGPVVASAAPAAQKLAITRAAAPAKAGSNLGGGKKGTIIAILAAVAIIGGIAIASGGSKSP